MDDHQVARWLAAGRIVIGAALLLTPGWAGGRWIGGEAGGRGTKVMIRALGIRDLALGAGTLRALDRGEPVQGWLVAGMASDSVDAAATCLAFRHLPTARSIPSIAIALGAAAVGVRLSARL